MATFDVDLDHTVLADEVSGDDELAGCLPGDRESFNLFERVVGLSHTQSEILGHVAVIRGIHSHC